MLLAKRASKFLLYMYKYRYRRILVKLWKVIKLLFKSVALVKKYYVVGTIFSYTLLIRLSLSLLMTGSRSALVSALAPTRPLKRENMPPLPPALLLPPVI